jgi:hypothetical protein
LEALVTLLILIRKLIELAAYLPVQKFTKKRKRERERERKGGRGKGERQRDRERENEKKKERNMFLWLELPVFPSGDRETVWIVSFSPPSGDKALLKTMQEALSIIVYLLCFHA